MAAGTVGLGTALVVGGAVVLLAFVNGLFFGARYAREWAIFEAAREARLWALRRVNSAISPSLVPEARKEAERARASDAEAALMIAIAIEELPGGERHVPPDRYDDSFLMDLEAR